MLEVFLLSPLVTTSFITVSFIIVLRICHHSTDPPMISEPPVPQVVTLPENTFNSRNDGTTIFRCTATASTSVAIVWLHDGRDASRLAADDTSRYNTAILDSETDGGITRVTSQLEIESVGVNDNGVVVCEAQVPTSEALEDPVTATAETTLTVLGEVQQLTVLCVIP